MGLKSSPSLCCLAQSIHPLKCFVSILSRSTGRVGLQVDGVEIDAFWTGNQLKCQFQIRPKFSWRCVHVQGNCLSSECRH